MVIAKDIVRQRIVVDGNGNTYQSLEDYKRGQANGKV